MMGISFKTQTVTPELAANLLKGSIANRPLDKHKIAQYARDMANKNWPLNGETIKLNDVGAPIDGYHRLNAVIKAGVPVDFIFATGVPTEAFVTIDTGKSRSTSAVLAMRGEKYWDLLSGAASYLAQYQHSGMPVSNSTFVRPTARDIVAIVDANPGLRQSVDRMGKQRRGVIAGGMGAVLHYLFAQTNDLKADEFFDHLIGGDELATDSPIYNLRERFLRERTYMPKKEQAALVIKAWNAFIAGKRVRVLRWASNEEFPRIIGCRIAPPKE